MLEKLCQPSALNPVPLALSQSLRCGTLQPNLDGEQVQAALPQVAKQTDLIAESCKALLHQHARFAQDGVNASLQELESMLNMKHADAGLQIS